MAPTLVLRLPAQEDGSDAIGTLARAMSPPHFPIGLGELRGGWVDHAASVANINVVRISRRTGVAAALA